MQQKLLFIGLVWPEPASSGAGIRTMQLINLFLEKGWSITFASAASESEHMEDLEKLGVLRETIAINDSAFDEFLQKLNPDVVLFDRFMVEEQFGWRVAEQCPNALRVLDTIDLHSLRLARQKASTDQVDFQVDDLFSDTAKREIASILRSDLSLLISEVEMDLLRHQFHIREDIIHYLPFLVDPVDDEMVQDWLPFKDRKDFVFIGNFLHEPNRNAVQYLKETLWPLIRKQLPDASMQIYGAYPNQQVMQWHQPKDRFLVLGRADDATAVVSAAKVLLAPLRFGAGAKGKLVQAMQCGTPSVTTYIGAESMNGDLPWNGFIAEDADAFVQAAVTLYSKEDIWRQGQRNGIAIVNERYEKSLFTDCFVDRLLLLKSQLQEHRNRNFLGSLLLHHSMASTKYMARWIEEKNKSR